ncbi:MAG: fructosamine kinase family protein [Trueperaceae bacterium]
MSRNTFDGGGEDARVPGHSPKPGLVHGDVWSGNVLARNGRITAMLDPAIYFADPEVELAFIELFATFGEAFWERYGELRPIDPGYREVRRDVYQLYPLLVHTALFGGGYVRAVGERLEWLGY